MHVKSMLPIRMSDYQAVGLAIGSLYNDKNFLVKHIIKSLIYFLIPQCGYS